MKDVALHLLDADLTWLSRERDGDLCGLVDMSDRRLFPQLLVEKNQRWVDAAAVLSRHVVTDLLRWSGDQIDAFHAPRNLQSEGWVSWASDTPVPYWFNLAQEFTERWVHQQQMREAVGRVEDHEARLPAVLQTFVWAFPHQLPPSTKFGPVEIAIEDIDVWTLTAADDGGWSLRASSARDPAARLCLTADAAWRLMTGAEVPEDAVTTEGDPALTGALMKVRAIIV